MIPLSSYLSLFLEKRFQSEGISLEKAKYIDDTLLDTPTLAIEALKKELD